MNALRFSCLVAGISGVVLAAQAQTIQFVEILRQANYVQTGSTITDVSADPVTPFRFRASIEGDDDMTSTNPLTAVTFTAPGGSPTALTFDSNSGHWTFEDTTHTSMANLNAAYTTGSYVFNPTGTPSTQASITVGSFASTLLQVPLLTLSGGAWVNGSYVINSSSTLTIAFSAVYTGSPAATAGFNFYSEISGQNYLAGPEGFVNWDPTVEAAATYASTPPSFVVNAGQLAPGQYFFKANYSDIQNFAPIYGSAYSASLLEYSTSVNLTVVPEPSTSAAALGALALLGAFVWRRRRLA